MPLPQPFPVEPGAVASYDFADIAGGTGTEIFETTVVDLSGSNLYVMDTNAIQTLGFGDGGFNTRLDQQTVPGEVTFETSQFNLPRIIEGFVYVAFTWTINNTSGSTGVFYQLVEVFKNTTSLGSQLTSPRTITNGNTRVTTSLVRIDCARTQISAGDQIKVKFTSARPDLGQHRLYHDLNNNDDSVNTPAVVATTNHTNLLIYVPFVVDV